MPRLSEIIGHPALTALLTRLLAANQLTHALLLEGVPGCGRRTLARAVAQALLCLEPVRGDACGRCRSCLVAGAGSHPDLVETRHDSEGGETGIDEMRDQVVGRAFESPLMGERRVFILYSVERLREASANALLKALEEPPAGTYFILTTSQAGAVLKTIRSRAQLFRLQALTTEHLRAILVAGGIPGPQAEARAQRGPGSHRGLWRDLEDIPLAQLRSLALEGFRSELVMQAVAALPTTLTAADEEAGRTVAGEQRRAVRQWLSVLAHDLSRRLRTDPDPGLASRIERVLSLERDLNLNLQPRLVIEAIGLDAERRR